MKFYIDLETREFIQGPGFRTPVDAPKFKRGDGAVIEVVFLTGGTTAASLGDPADLSLKFGAKVNGDYDGDYIVSEDAWTIPDAEAEQVYSCSPSFNTVALNDALGVGTETELASVAIMVEIEWTLAGGAPTSTRTLIALVENDVNRGTEGTPVENSTPDEWLDTRAVRHDVPRILTAGGKANARDSLGLGFSDAPMFGGMVFKGFGHTDQAPKSVVVLGTGATDVRLVHWQDKDGTVALLSDVEHIVKTTSFTAEAGKRYLCNGMLTVTDPATPNEGDSYEVRVLYYVATIGGVGYQRSKFPVWRVYQSGQWRSAESVLSDQLELLFQTAASETSAMTRALGDARYAPISGTLNLTGNQTAAGAKTFSGQMELTGQDTTNPTSAMTRAMTDRRGGAFGYTIPVIPGRGIGGWTATQTGGGTGASPAHGATVSASSDSIALTTSDAAAATGKIVMTGFIAGILVRPGTPDWNNGINYAVPMMWSFRFYNGIAPSATMTGWVKFGGVRSPEESFGGPTQKSVGLKQVGTSLYGYVHDGTTLTVGTVNLQTMVVGAVHHIEIVGNGNGTFQFFVNRVLKDTLTSGPTGNGSAANTLMGVYIDNGGTAGNKQIALVDLALTYLA